MKLNKKGQALEQIGAIGIGIVIFTITLIVAFLVIANTQTQNIDQATETTTTRELLAYTNATAENLANSPS